jgi:DNA-binding IclR family transcriptional regulator
MQLHMRIQFQLKRIIDILFLINESRYGWTAKELAKKYKVHPRTVSRDLDTLAQMMYAANKDGKWYGLGNPSVTKLKDQSCTSGITK